MRSILTKALLAALCFGLVPVAAEAKSKSKKEAAQVECSDGTTSKAGRGACSHHGGVAKNATSEARETQSRAKDSAAAPGRESQSSTKDSANPAARADSQPRGRAPAPEVTAPRSGTTSQPTARCKDGSLSYSQHRSGTCSRHGGVGEWLTGR
ncbi:MAG: DUF3761 domain-containing protein [Deltaproteobacteria bacterium]|nr:MAG: DUF3761 domain-containing protein [Deltaproteobacteria bacterium]